ncbi:MAG: AAA family ATPase [Caldilineaceae bacterium]|nr:AAA family ATPase [Caldilineaceae bacterium]
MPVTAFRLQNFMGFEDTDWIDLSNINLLFGNNSAGKSAIIRALLLLQQSIATWRPTDINGRQERRQDSLVFSEPNGHDLGSFREVIRDHDTNRAMKFSFRHQFSLAENREIHRYFDGFLATLQLLGIVASDLDPDAYQFETVMLDTELSYRLQSIGDQKQIALSAFGLYRSTDNWDILEAELDESSGEWRFESSTFGIHDPSFAWPSLRFVTRSSFFPLLDAPEGGLPQPRRADYGLGANFSAYVYEIRDNPVTVDASSELLKETGDTLTAFQTLLNFTLRDDIHRFVAFSYLGPVRPEPQRYIRAIQRPAIVSNPSLEDVLRLWLDAKADVILGERLAQFNDWLEKAFGLHFYFRPVDRHNQVFEFIVKDSTGLESNLADVGFGISQLLPILIHAACGDEMNLLIIEQPELHLHPSGQADLADMLIKASCDNAMKFFIETHSEHLLLRIRRRIAENTAGISDDVNLNCCLSDESIAVYFVYLDKNRQSICKSVKIDSFGKMSGVSEFRGFFSDDLRELAYLNKAILSTKGNE